MTQEIEPKKLKVDIFPLGETPGSPNPGSRLYLEIDDGIVISSEGNVLLQSDPNTK